jgi:hypothetical protein
LPLFSGKTQLAAEPLDCSLAAPPGPRASQGAQKPLGVARRSQQVGRLGQ